VFYFDGRGYASFVGYDEGNNDCMLEAMEYHNMEIKAFKETCHGYYDITFSDGKTIYAVSFKHITQEKQDY